MHLQTNNVFFQHGIIRLYYGTHYYRNYLAPMKIKTTLTLLPDLPYFPEMEIAYVVVSKIIYVISSNSLTL